MCWTALDKGGTSLPTNAQYSDLGVIRLSDFSYSVHVDTMVKRPRYIRPIL